MMYTENQHSNTADNTADTNTENDTREQDNLSYIMKTGGVISRSEDETIHCLTIIGQIEGHYILGDGQKATKYEHIIPLLVSIEESNEIDGLLLVLNTMGGDVEAGLALAEMIASMSKPTVSLVLGGGHSIGVPLAVSADVSFIVPSATMTIHPVRMSGTVIGVPQTYFYFERMQNRIIRFITDHSSVEEQAFRDMLLKTDEIATDTGSIIDGYQAVECGLIDRTGGVSDALSELRHLIRQYRAEHPSDRVSKENRTDS